MNSKSTVTGGDSSRVKNKVSHLSVENIGGDPVGVVGIVISVVCVSVDQTKSVEVGGTLDDGEIGRITNKIGIILVNDGTRDQVSSGWEVDGGRGCGAGCAESATSAT